MSMDSDDITQLSARAEIWEARKGDQTREFLVLNLCPGLRLVKYGPDWSQIMVLRLLGWIGWKPSPAILPNA